MFDSGPKILLQLGSLLNRKFEADVIPDFLADSWVRMLFSEKKNKFWILLSFRMELKPKKQLV